MIDRTATNKHQSEAEAVLLEALQELVGCAGLTWLPGYREELDEAMRKAHQAIYTTIQARVKGGCL